MFVYVHVCIYTHVCLRVFLLSVSFARSLSFCQFFFLLANNYIFFSLVGFFSLMLQMTLIRLEMKALSGLTLCFVSTSVERKSTQSKEYIFNRPFSLLIGWCSPSCERTSFVGKRFARVTSPASRDRNRTEPMTAHWTRAVSLRPCNL